MARKVNSSNAIRTELGSKKYDDLFPSIKYNDSDDNILLTVGRYVLNENRVNTFRYIGKRGVMQILDYSEEGSADYITYDREGVIEDKDCIMNTMSNGIICISYTDENAFNKVFEIMKSLRVPLSEIGWEIIDDVSTYVGPGKSAIVMQNKTRFADVVMINGKNRWKTLHLCASAISRLFPWAFEAEPLTETETATLKLIYDDKWPEFKKSMYEVVKSGDFYKKILEAKLKDFANDSLNRRIRDLKDDIRRENGKIDDWYRKIRDADGRIEEMNDQLTVYVNKIIQGDNDSAGMIEYLSSNRSLTLLGRDGDVINLAAVTYLTEFDDDAFASYVRNKKDKGNYVYRYSPYDVELTKKLYRSIWEDQRWMVRTFSGWSLSSGFYAHPDNDLRIPDEIKKNRIPQPHIWRYTCVGNYRKTFEDCQKKHDYIGAMTTIVSSSSSLNWTDSTVVESFMSDFWNDESGSFLEDKDGNLYTVKEVVDILKEEMKNAPVAC